MPELLLEILSEEIPARMQARAADDLKRLVTDGLKAAGLEFSSADAYVTPRRLTLVVDGLPEKQPDVAEEKRGPNVNAPEQAINGFKGSLPEGAVIEERETPKGVFFFAQVDSKGAATAEVLSRLVSKAMSDLPWPKSMRWAAYPGRWVRPMHAIICLFDSAVVSAEFGPISAADHTLGHRFLAPDPITVTDFADYKQKLLAAKVMLDPAERRAKIEADAQALCEAKGLSLKDDPGLLDEVTGLVEWPVVYVGQIDDDYMDLPDEVLSTSMRAHQKYFSTLGKDGNLANRFIVVANTETMDGGKQVVAGNERVLRARLSDAKFFWDQDRASSLESFVPFLEEMTFHADLGTVAEKIYRNELMSEKIAFFVQGAETQAVLRAIRLCKADLASSMVGEFPELQGIMGRYYALKDDEDQAVADAIEEHYAPKGPNDLCPTKPVSVAVALVDKLYDLIGLFAVGVRPTGSKDPFALRRAALGVIRLILENRLRIPLRKFFFEFAGYVETNRTVEEDDAVADELLTFFTDRLKVHLREQGVRHDLIDAVMALGDEDDLVRLVARVHALQDFLGTDDGANLLTAYKRAANILRIEEKKDGKVYAGESSIDAAVEAEEHDLIKAISTHGPKILSAIEDEDFQAAMTLMAAFRTLVDAYFEKVTVNADDPGVRENRLNTLAHVRRTMDQVADFSKIEGGKA